MSLNRVVSKLKIVLFGHIFNWFWRARNKRRAVRCRVISSVIPKYFGRYLPSVAALPVLPVIKNDENEKIFTLWLQGEENAPELVKSCFRSVRRHCEQDLIILNEKTLFDNIDLPGVIMDKRKNGKIANAHFADIARIELLHNNGGFWLDSTGFVTSPIPKIITDQDFFVYMAGQNVGSPYGYIQNCFIRARQGSYLLEGWREMVLEYWKNEPREFDYFMHQLMFKTLVMGDKRAAEFFAKMPHIDQDPTHALWWGYHDKPFNQELFNKLTADSFFQKTTYRQAANPVPGSFADAMIKM